MVVDPRFNRSASVADFYAPIRSGSDIVFLGGVINYLLTNDKIHHEYVKNYTDFSFIVREDFAFDEGIFSGYNPEKRTYDKGSWDYELGDDGFVKVDPRWSTRAASISGSRSTTLATPREGGVHLRHAQGEIPARVRSWLRPLKLAVLPPSCTPWAGLSTPQAHRFCAPAP